MSRLTIELGVLAAFVLTVATQIGIGTALMLIGVLIGGVVLGLGLTWLMERIGR